MSTSYSLENPGLRWLRQYGLITAVYIVATWFTNAWLMGDTVDYVDAIVAHHEGRYLQFWEFGHLLWRPFGWLAFRLLNPLTNLILGPDDRSKITFTLLTINWVGGLACLLLLRALITRVCDREWIINLATIALLFSAAFLNYGQTGSAYVPGLALVLLSALLLVRNAERPVPGVLTAVFAGVSLAAAVCLWIPFVLLIPAALTLPLFLLGWNRRQLHPLIWTCVSLALCTAIAYAIVIAILGINNLADLKIWVTSASHGMDRMRGIPRMIFGFSNSLIDLGGEGAVYKRYLKHDPFNPVSATGLFRSSLWKLLFCYLFIAAMLLNLLRSDKGRRLIGLMVFNAFPTVIFALFIFEAGDMSRYILILPLVFLAFAYSLCSEKSWPLLKYLSIGFIAVLIVTNVRAMSISKLQEKEERNASRVRELLPLLKPQSIVLVSHLQDDLANFTRDFLFNPINRAGNLHYGAVLVINTSQVDHWREDTARQVLASWDKGADVWLTKRLLSPRPRLDWNWVEGDDTRVSWTDLYNYFSKLEVGQSVGGDDGFVLLVPSDRNKAILTPFASKPGQSREQILK